MVDYYGQIVKTDSSVTLTLVSDEDVTMIPNILRASEGVFPLNEAIFIYKSGKSKTVNFTVSGIPKFEHLPTNLTTGSDGNLLLSLELKFDDCLQNSISTLEGQCQPCEFGYAQLSLKTNF